MPARKRRATGATRAADGLYEGRPFAERFRLEQRGCLARLNRRDTLLGLVRALHASLEPDHIAAALATHAGGWIPLTCWAVVASDAQEQLFVLAADSGLAAELRAPIYGAAQWVVTNDDVLVSGDLSLDPRVSVTQPAAAVAFPLRGRERVVGALVGIDRGVSATMPALGIGIREVLHTLLGPAAFALDTALLLKRTEALSVTDDLTRLYNARYLNMALRRETRLASRSNRPLSLLFIDLDGFKSINDSHGHLAGSRALVEAGAVIRGSARETDIVARFGGDEFALILPDTGSPGALAVAERIRARVSQHSFLVGDGLDIHLTASVGVATLPDVAATADELVQAADAAMYRVKDRGKNGVEVAAPGR